MFLANICGFSEFTLTFLFIVIFTSPDSTMKKESAKSPYENKTKTEGEIANLVDNNPLAYHTLKVSPTPMLRQFA